MDWKNQGTFDSLYDGLLHKLRSAKQLEAIREEFSKLSSDEERVANLLANDLIATALKVPEITVIKSVTRANNFRNKGNKLFQSGCYLEALRLYNESVAFAPCIQPEAETSCDGGEPASEEGKDDITEKMSARLADSDTNNEFVLALANRSAALFHLQQYSLCLADIEQALHLGYPKQLTYKLFDRRAKCLLQLDQGASAKLAFEEAFKSLTVSSLDDKKRQTWRNDITKHLSKCSTSVSSETSTSSPTKLNSFKTKPSHYLEFKQGQEILSRLAKLQLSETKPQLPDCHNVFRSLSSACEVKYTENAGRFIVATRDIEPGELILVEKPYASVLLDDKYSTHCHHCMSRYIVCVPCSGCPVARYCSTTCQQMAAMSYHAVECSCLALIHQSGVGKFGHLAVRTVTKSGREYLQAYRHQLQSGSFAASKLLEGCNQDGLYLHSEYNAIKHLVTHDSDRPVEDLFRRAAMAVFLLRCLERTVFFQGVTESDDFRAFTGGLILSHLQSFPCNAHEVPELELNLNDIARSGPAEIGAGIYATLSLFNHSCDPVANRNFYGDACAVRAIKAIRPGDEIADNYGAVYAVHTRSERHEKLRPQYYFTCGCTPCKEDWPLYNNIPSTKALWICSSCCEPLPSVSLPTIQCPKCTSEQNIVEKQRTHQLYCMNSPDTFTKLLEGDVDGAMPPLFDQLSFICRNVKLPWLDYNNCQEALKQCFSIKANCSVMKATGHK